MTLGYTYRELQDKLRSFRNAGAVLPCKLNASKEVLEDALCSIHASLFERETETDPHSNNENDSQDEVFAVDVDALDQLSELLVKEGFYLMLATSNLLMVDISADKPAKLCRYHDKILLVTPTGIESEHVS